MPHISRKWHNLWTVLILKFHKFPTIFLRINFSLTPNISLIIFIHLHMYWAKRETIERASSKARQRICSENILRQEKSSLDSAFVQWTRVCAQLNSGLFIHFIHYQINRECLWTFLLTRSESLSAAIKKLSWTKVFAAGVVTQFLKTKATCFLISSLEITGRL